MSDDYAGPGVPSFGPRWCYCLHGPNHALRWGHQFAPEAACPIDAPVTEREAAAIQYPDHAPSTALANFKAGREVWDTNGDLR